MTCRNQSGASSMSDRFNEIFGKKRGLLSDNDTNDGTYEPWVTDKHRSAEAPTKLGLVPALHVSPEVWRIPYLQVMLQCFNRDTGLLRLMFPGSGVTVLIEGTGLEKLDDLIEERKVRSIHMFDPAIHRPVHQSPRANLS